MTFIEWLQTRLNIHGASLGVDGVWGVNSRNALRSFQRARHITATGTADEATVARLKLEPGSRTVTVPVPAERMPLWLAEATRVMGLHEKRNRTGLMAWLRSDGKTLGDPSKLPWCGDYTQTAILRALPSEPIPNNPYWARNWAKFGVQCGPIVGAIGVIAWDRGGHVGFVVDTKPGYVKLRGGNQSNAVTDAWFPTRRFIAFRWPASVPIKTYPPVTGSASRGGDRAATR